MPSPSSLGRRPVAGFAPVLLANLLPLVGVVRFGWDPATLVAIYAIEVLFSFPLAAVKALFAQRPPRTDREAATVISVSNELSEKRGRLDAVPWLPPIYPRNVPFALAVLGAAGWVGMILAFVLVELFPVVGVLARPDVIAGVLALVAGQSIETYRDYFRDDRYETTTPYAVIETPARRAFFLAFVLFAVPAIGTDGAGAALGAFVLVKLLVEWSARRATDGGGRLTRWLSGPDEATAEDGGPIPVPDGEPDIRVPIDRRAVLCTGLLDTLSRLAPFYASWFLIGWLVVLVVLGDGASRTAAIRSGLLVCGLFVALVAVRVVTFYFRYGPLEYRRYGDRIVAYDTFLDAPQWSVSIGTFRDVTVVSDRLPDRLLGTRTIAATTGWGDDETGRTLGPVRDADALLETFEVPARMTALEPIDRRVAAVVAACVAALVVAVGLIAFGPWLSATALLYVVFLLPFVALPLRGLWKRAYPDPDE